MLPGIPQTSRQHTSSVVATQKKAAGLKAGQRFTYKVEIASLHIKLNLKELLVENYHQTLGEQEHRLAINSYL